MQPVLESFVSQPNRNPGHTLIKNQNERRLFLSTFTLLGLEWIRFRSVSWVSAIRESNFAILAQRFELTINPPLSSPGANCRNVGCICGAPSQHRMLFVGRAGND